MSGVAVVSRVKTALAELMKDTVVMTVATAFPDRNAIGSGEIFYEPDLNYVGPDSFGYQVCPQSGGFCISASVNGTVTGTPLISSVPTTPLDLVTPEFTG